jgi:enoyl-CoA hydratase/carnithine racemase
MGDAVLYRVEDGVAWITLNEPEKANRLSYRIMGQLVDFVHQAGEDPRVKVIVITGSGDKAFCAGASLDEFEHGSVLESKNHLEAYARICRVFNSVPKPSIAMINGYAMGGGCGLAMLPTFSIASEDALLACPEIKVGVWPMMVMAILFRTVGRKKGLEFICMGEPIDGREAEKIGMVTKAVPREELRDSVMSLCDTLKSKSSEILRLGLEAFHNCADMEYDKAVSYLRDMAVILTNTPDSVEGTRAFLEKREARWSDYLEAESDER